MRKFWKILLDCKPNMFIKNPTTKLPDTHLTAAVYGFIFSILLILLGFCLSFKTNDEMFIKYLSEIVGLFYGPTILAYSFRAYSKTKYKNESVGSNE